MSRNNYEGDGIPGRSKPIRAVNDSVRGWFRPYAPRRRTYYLGDLGEICPEKGYIKFQSRDILDKVGLMVRRDMSEAERIIEEDRLRRRVISEFERLGYGEEINGWVVVEEAKWDETKKDISKIFTKG
jgi:hypothetical protein